MTQLLISKTNYSKNTEYLKILKSINSIKVPGKIILTGEYSVLFGKHAIAFPINKYLYCHIKQNFSNTLLIELNDLNIKRTFSLNEIIIKGKIIEDCYHKNELIIIDPLDFVVYLLYKFQTTFSVSIKDISITISSEILINHGLGSSAAIIVCLIKALSKFYNLQISNSSFIDFAIKIENIIHKKSSGVDINTMEALQKSGLPIKSYKKGFLS
ncbi:MAG: hypothetical protein GY830_11215 [Bacteroidetes bacterium]|nr:hypothetical protein [Bacteroidota bacterium]